MACFMIDYNKLCSKLCSGKSITQHVSLGKLLIILEHLVF